MRTKLDHAVGLIVIFLALTLTGYATGLVPALIFLAWLILLRQLLLYLLAKDSRVAKTVALLLMPTAVFLFFLPKRIKNQMQELSRREQTKT